MRGLDGKVAVIAGGGSGIGATTAMRLASEGASVVVGDLVGDNALNVANEIVDNGGKAIGVTFDIATEAGADALVSAAVSTFGGIDSTPPICRPTRSCATATPSRCPSRCSIERSR